MAPAPNCIRLGALARDPPRTSSTERLRRSDARWQMLRQRSTDLQGALDGAAGRRWHDSHQQERCGRPPSSTLGSGRCHSARSRAREETKRAPVVPPCGWTTEPSMGQPELREARRFAPHGGHASTRSPERPRCTREASPLGSCPRHDYDFPQRRAALHLTGGAAIERRAEALESMHMLRISASISCRTLGLRMAAALMLCCQAGGNVARADVAGARAALTKRHTASMSLRTERPRWPRPAGCSPATSKTRVHLQARRSSWVSDAAELSDGAKPSDVEATLLSMKHRRRHRGCKRGDTVRRCSLLVRCDTSLQAPTHAADKQVLQMKTGCSKLGKSWNLTELCSLFSASSDI